jgi:CspA family cold shock protein
LLKFYFNATKGFGFIQPDSGGKRIFVHITNVVGRSPLTVGERVLFETQLDRNGKPEASGVKVA